MYTIGEAAKQFGLSRSTLLYYDRKGLLSPTGRTPSNYRLYSSKDLSRLEQIRQLRDAGIPLESIATLLDKPSGRVAATLQQRLDQLNHEIAGLRQQQQLIVHLLGRDELLRNTRIMNKQRWVNLLQACGMDEQQMRQWHRLFEHEAPEAHQDFLESLGIDQDEIMAIRTWARAHQT